MPGAQSITNADCISNQYKSAANLAARLRLHNLFRTNKYGGQRWLFDRLKFPQRGCVLELGCGTGNLWSENADQIPEGLEIILSDLSVGMLQEARRNTGGITTTFRFEVIDAQSIPFREHYFDIVIANNMLYHLPDRAGALGEIRRVLKPDGRFYASTIGKNHLKELNLLVRRFDASLDSWGKGPTAVFSLENGATQIDEYFSGVSLYRYEDSLIVTEAEPLTDYILSGMPDITPERRLELSNFVKMELQASNNRFYITKDWGVFESIGLHF